MNWWVCWNLVCTIFISWLLCVLTNPCYIHHWWQKCEWDVLSVSSHLLSHWLLLLYFQCLPTCICQDTVLFETVSLITIGTFSDPSLHCHGHLNPTSSKLCFPQTLLPPQLATHATWNMHLDVFSHTSNRLIVVSPCINIGSCSRNGSAHFHQCYCFSVIVYSDIVFILALSATWLLLCYGHLCCPCVVLQIQFQPMVPLFIELYFISIASMKTPG